MLAMTSRRLLMFTQCLLFVGGTTQGTVRTRGVVEPEVG
jgi:hypothetical protein